MVQFTYVPPTMCKWFPTLKNNTELFSSCKNVCIDERNISTRGIFIWDKTEGDILDAGGHKYRISGNWHRKGDQVFVITKRQKSGLRATTR